MANGFVTMFLKEAVVALAVWTGWKDTYGLVLAHNRYCDFLAFVFRQTNPIGAFHEGLYAAAEGSSELFLLVPCAPKLSVAYGQIDLV
jgi:hypothetical protein